MNTRFWIFLAISAAFAASSPGADEPAPAPLYAVTTPPYRPSAGEWRTLREGCAALEAEVGALEGRADPEPLADVAVYPAAVEYLIRFPDRFFLKTYYPEALDALAEGRRRAGELARGALSWANARGLVVLGYRSRVDGTYQPCVVRVPDDYDPHRPARLDVILHGRNTRLNGVSFIASAQNGKIVATEPGGADVADRLKLYVFGRGNNSYRWSGETDVFEALASVRRRYAVDPDRIVLRGFSMGGAGAWHLGLHFPDRWAAVEAGAGYVQTRPEVLATIHDPWRLASLAIHDASNCAENLTDLPFVAYAGSLDPTLAENETIRRNLAAAGFGADALPRARFLVGEGVNHRFRPDRKAQSEAFIASSLPRRRPDRFDFVAYTPRYGRFWDLRIDSLERLYEPASVRGSWDRIATRNVWVLRLDRPRAIEIDGQRLTGDVFEREDGRWRTGEPAGLRKRPGLQGPIDDAFQEAFLCVPPDGGADSTLGRFRDDFARYFFGDVPIKSAGEVTPEDIADKNLVLFGTPATNSLLRRVLPSLPVRWTPGEIRLGGRAFSAADCTLAMIYPNPLNPRRYVVLNSGHTFPGRDCDDMHWFLHPRLGDYAVLDARTRTVKVAGFFDRAWKLPSDLFIGLAADSKTGKGSGSFPEHPVGGLFGPRDGTRFSH